MNLITLASTISSKEKAVAFLQEKGILHDRRRCAFGHEMSLSVGSDRWRCNKRTCRTEIGIRRGTWLEGSRVDFQKVVLFIYCWSKELTSVEFCNEELSLNHNTTVDWNNYLREVCAWRLIQNSTVIGGDGLHVEIDESMFSRRKNEVGRVLPQQWVFGGICRETREVFLYTVPDRSRQTLESVIRNSIAPGSIIVSDGWAAYNYIDQIDGMNYSHQVVNHSENFVDPTTGAHTQTIESMWHLAKMRNKRQCGTHRTLLESYLCEFMWRKRLQTKGNAFDCILSDIVSFWPPS